MRACRPGGQIWSRRDGLVDSAAGLHERGAAGEGRGADPADWRDAARIGDDCRGERRKPGETDRAAACGMERWHGTGLKLSGPAMMRDRRSGVSTCWPTPGIAATLKRWSNAGFLAGLSRMCLTAGTDAAARRRSPGSTAAPRRRRWTVRSRSTPLRGGGRPQFLDEDVEYRGAGQRVAFLRDRAPSPFGVRVLGWQGGWQHS